jgi:hypothetical protein
MRRMIVSAEEDRWLPDLQKQETNLSVLERYYQFSLVLHWKEMIWEEPFDFSSV